MRLLIIKRYLGSNKEPKDEGPDTQNATVIYDLKNEFKDLQI